MKIFMNIHPLKQRIPSFSKDESENARKLYEMTFILIF